MILNVDDFEPQRYARSTILRSAGFDVLEAATGSQALAIVRDRRPALVLLDVHLPDLDGLEVCRRIKSEKTTASVLVLHVSATFREVAHRAAALDNGADGYLPEPVAPDELIAHVRALLRLARAEAAAREAQQQLREVADSLRAFFDAPGVLMSVVELMDDDVIYRLPNKNLAALFGTTVEQLTGKRGRDVGLAEEDTRRWLAEYRRRREEQPSGPLTIEYASVVGDTSRWYEATISEVRSGPRRVAAVTMVDVTERVEARNALVHSEETARRKAEELEKLMDLAPAAIWISNDTKCRNIVGNRYANALYEARGGENVSPWSPDGDQDARRRVFRDGVEVAPEELPIQKAAATGTSVGDVELELVLPSGRARTIIGSAVPLFDAEGRTRGAVGVFHDISERTRIERALREAKETAEAREAEIASIYDSAPIGLCIFDRQGRFMRVNRRLAEMNGLSVASHVGRTVADVVPGIAAGAEEAMRRVFATGQPELGVEVVGEAPSQPGVTRAWLQNWYPVKDQDGEVIAVNVAVEEITRLKEVENELRRASRVKDDFLATLSHELRTPLTAILGWAHLLQTHRVAADAQREALKAISRNAEAQAQLISDVLDVSRMTAGKIRLELEEVDLLDVLRLAVESFRPAFDEKRVSLSLESEEQEAIVTGDRHRLEQVVGNLLSNAVKFTPEGGRVVVRLRRESDAVEVVVSDTGAGIAPHLLPQVFDRFVQGDTSASRRHGGLGLGLSIVRQLVELHGGSVDAASEGEGRGAAFTVRLPVRAVRAGADAFGESVQAAFGDVGRAPRLDRLRVLILDDLQDARALMAAVVGLAGAGALQAASAEEALSLLSNEAIDVVLADLGMPGTDGYEFLRRLRSTAKGRGVPVVAVTAYGGKADRRKALAAGFDEHLSKPVLPGDLIGVIARVTARTIVN